MTASVAPAEPEAGTPNRFGLREWLRWFWRQLTSMRVALVLLFLLALASVPGSLFPQRGVDPAAVQRYFTDHPGTAPWLDAVSMFDVYAAPWFAAIYLLLCISLAGCILPRIVEHARALRRPPPPAPSRLDRLAGYESLVVRQGADEVLQQAAARLRGKRWRVRSGEGWVSAEKGYLRETGNLIFHSCLLLLLAGVALGSLFGWHASVIVVEGRGFSNTVAQYDTFTSGRLVDRAGLSPFSLQLQDFTATYQRGGQQNGAPRDFSATVTYRSAPGQPTQDATISVNHPLEVNGAKVYLQGHGYAPHVIVRDAAGTVLYDDSAVFLPRDANFTSMGVVKVPDSDPQLGLQAIFLPTGVVDPHRGPISTFPSADDPGLFLSAWQGDLGLDSGVPQSVFRLDTSHMTKIGLESLQPGQTWTMPQGAGTVEFVGVDEYASFNVAENPGKELALWSAGVAIAGLVLSLFVPRRRVWVRASPEGGRTLVTVAGLARTENSTVADDTAALASALADDHEGAM